MPGLLPINRRNTRWWHALNSASRSAILRGATRPFANNVIVNEYPKSGGSWLSQMLSECLELPFPRNRLPMLNSCLMQCHALNPAGMRNVIVVWRDGRDIVVSYYYYLIIGHEFGDTRQFEQNAKLLGITDPNDIKSNLPAFIDGLMATTVGPSFSWPEFVKRWHGREGIIETRYEDLLSAPNQELQRIVTSLTGKSPSQEMVDSVVQKYSFKSQSGRDSGTEKHGSFLRKGVAGDWTNHFTPEAIARFNYHAKDAMNALGYCEAQ